MRKRWLEAIARVAVVLLLCLGETAKAAESPEDIFWQSVRKSDVMEEYRLYVEQYPKGKHIAEAWRQIGRLEAQTEARRQVDEDPRKTEREAQSAEQHAWEKAENTKTLEAYRYFLNNYPRGRYAKQATEKAKQLETTWSDNDGLGYGYTCAANSECRSYLVCVNNRCGLGASPKQRGDSQWSSNGLGYGYSCTGDSECRSDLRCVSGRCGLSSK